MSDSCDSDDYSEDSVTAEEVLEMVIEDERLCYLCRTTEGEQLVIDRSDLIDGAAQQRLVLHYERTHPPPWDERCFWCLGDGCEECECDQCERKCRHLNGINYGCTRHPVV